MKYKNFRFYFITDGFKLKCVSEKDLSNLLLKFVRMSNKLKFVRMSNKQNQQKIINEIKTILKTIGYGGFWKS